MYQFDTFASRPGFHGISSAGDFWDKKNRVTFWNSRPLNLEINKKCNSDFLLIFILAKSVSTDAFTKENIVFVNQTLHCSNEFNKFIVCHKLSFHVTVTLILFFFFLYVLLDHS